MEIWRAMEISAAVRRGSFAVVVGGVGAFCVRVHEAEGLGLRRWDGGFGRDCGIGCCCCSGAGEPRAVVKDWASEEEKLLLFLEKE